MEEEELSKSEINAERILKRCHVHDLDNGGVFTEITGCQGSGKTSVMLSFMNYTINHYPDEKIFWSNCYNSPLQFPKIGAGKFHIMVMEGSNVTFHNRANKLEQIYPKVTYFTDFNDLCEKSLSGVCNAVFFGDRSIWMQFIHHLRSIGEWSHIYIDELSEIAPSFSSGKIWHNISKFGVDLKEVRKCMLNVHTNSQSVSDIDHRVRSKIMIKIYLPGAKSDGNSRITQRAIDNLNEDSINGNDAYLEFSGKFGRTRFRDIYKPIPGMQWEARVNE